MVCSGETCETTDPTTLSEGPYRWWIQTWNSSGYGPWSAPMDFAVVAEPPARPTLISPTGTVYNPIVTYTWNAVAWTTQYQLWVNDADGVRVLLRTYAASDVTSGSTCSITETEPLVAGTYRWWIRGGNEFGWGAWSAPLAFTVVNTPAATTLISPSGTISDPTPEYAWNAVYGSTWYLLWVNNSSGVNVIQRWYSGATVCADGTCAAEDPVSLTPGTYRWWVQTWNTNGYGPWSEPLDVTLTE